jgi:AcrR family transcriptional regulator
MSEGKSDRRVQKTRQALQEALITLVLEKGYDAVMVQDILDRANVGRSTFYAHYQDKDDLLANRFEDLQKAFEDHAQLILAQSLTTSEEINMEVNLPLFVLRYMEHEHRLFKALLGKQGSTKHGNHFRGFFLKYTRNVLKNHARTQLSPYQLEIVAQYLTSAFMTPVIWWIDNDMPCSVDELYGLIARLIEPGLKDVLGVSTLWT